MDHTVNQKLTLFGRYNYSPSENIQRGGRAPRRTRSLLTEFNTQTLTGGVTWNVTPQLINDFRINWSQNKGASYGKSTILAEPSLSLSQYFSATFYRPG